MSNGKKTDKQYKLIRANENWTVRNEKHFKMFDENPCMTGYIKNFAWHYENEVRLKITTPYDIGHEKIQIKIPLETIDAFEITTGPCFEYKNDNLYKSLMNQNKISESDFTNMVKYRLLCSLCKHEKFQKK